MSASKEQIHQDLQGILSNFQGRQYTAEIGLDTQFFGGLGLVSIDAVVLGETLENYYGTPIPFHEFLAELREEEVEDIEVGRLVEFLYHVLAADRYRHS